MTLNRPCNGDLNQDIANRDDNIEKLFINRHACDLDVCMQHFIVCGGFNESQVACLMFTNQVTRGWWAFEFAVWSV